MTAPEGHALVLLPGMDGTEVMFAPLLAALPRSLQPDVVTYAITGANTYDEVLPRVLDAVRRHASCHVLGWSFSGPLALRAASLEPQRVRGVVLAASFVQPPQRWLRWAGPLVGTPTFAALRVLRRLPGWLLGPPADPLRRAKAQVWQRVPGRTLAARVRAIRRVDARADLLAPRAVLYLAGDTDRIVPPHNLAAIRRARPDVEVATLRGDHFALFTDAIAAARAIGEFVRASHGAGIAGK